jgi:hypothetical protein
VSESSEEFKRKSSEEVRIFKYESEMVSVCNFKHESDDVSDSYILSSGVSEELWMLPGDEPTLRVSRLSACRATAFSGSPLHDDETQRCHLRRLARTCLPLCEEC